MTIGELSFLQITARSEAFHEGFAYTSGRIHTRNHPVAGRIMPPKTGDGAWVNNGGVRIEARVRLPQGTPSGTWPAFWMLPTDKVYSVNAQMLSRECMSTHIPGAAEVHVLLDISVAAEVPRFAVGIGGEKRSGSRQSHENSSLQTLAEFPGVR